MQPVPLADAPLDRWRHPTLRGRADGQAWVEDRAVVVLVPGRLHALPAPDEPPFGPTARLLTALRHRLPRHLEVRAGAAMGGILAEHHHLELLGPVQRLRPGAPATSDPPGLVRLSPTDGARVAALRDRDAPFHPSWLERGPWWGVVDGDRLVAAVGIREAGPRGSLLAAPILTRPARDRGASLLAAAARRLHGDAALDLRMDRRARVQQALDAGFIPVLRYERWRAVAR